MFKFAIRHDLERTTRKQTHTDIVATIVVNKKILGKKTTLVLPKTLVNQASIYYYHYNTQLNTKMSTSAWVDKQFTRPQSVPTLR